MAEVGLLDGAGDGGGGAAHDQEADAPDDGPDGGVQMDAAPFAAVAQLPVQVDAHVGEAVVPVVPAAEDAAGAHLPHGEADVADEVGGVPAAPVLPAGILRQGPAVAGGVGADGDAQPLPEHVPDGDAAPGGDGLVVVHEQAGDAGLPVHGAEEPQARPQHLLPGEAPVGQEAVKGAADSFQHRLRLVSCGREQKGLLLQDIQLQVTEDHADVAVGKVEAQQVSRLGADIENGGPPPAGGFLEPHLQDGGLLQKGLDDPVGGAGGPAQAGLQVLLGPGPVLLKGVEDKQLIPVQRQQVQSDPLR